MVFNAPQISSCVLAKSTNAKKYPFGRRKVSTLAAAECELSVDHVTVTLAILWETPGCGHATFWLPQCPSYSMNVVVHIGKQRLSKSHDSHPINTSSRTKRRPAVLSTMRKVWMVRSTQAGTRKRFERIVQRRRDMRRPIPFRTRGSKVQPASGHSCRSTSLWWRTRRTAFKGFQVFFVSTSSSFSRSLQQRWPLRSGPAHCRSDDRQARSALRARPSCCGFWNLVNAQAWKLLQAYWWRTRCRLQDENSRARRPGFCCCIRRMCRHQLHKILNNHVLTDK